MKFLRIVVLVVLIAGGIFAWRDYSQFADTALGLPAPTTIDVPMGTQLPGILRELEHQHVRTGQTLYWRLLARQMGVAGKLHAGEYALDAGITPRALLAKMAAGEVIQHHFTIVEGWTFAQLRDALAHDIGLKQTLATSSDAAIMRSLGAADTPAEGQFLPETYNYVKSMEDVDILRRAHKAMIEALDKQWNSRAADLTLKSPYEALILASIVEKETARVDERPMIAGVFLRRLKIGMRLQTDPTVIYGLGAAYDGKIHTRDLDTDTPFNTYTRDGLPPTPIALPGAAALSAVLHPSATDALYFVARGEHQQQFGFGAQTLVRGIEQQRAHRLTHRRAAGFARDDDVAAALGQQLAHGGEHGALACAFSAFKRDQSSAHRL